MKILFLSLLVAAASAGSCPGVFINQTYYDVEVIKEDLHGVIALDFDRNHNTVYYTREANDTTVLEYVKLDDKSTGVIDIENPKGIAIDIYKGKSRLYVGTTNGLYEIELNDDKTPKRMNVSVIDDIKYVFVRKHDLFYVSENKTAYKVLSGFNNLVTKVLELGDVVADKFIIDNSFNIHFLNGNKLTKVKRTTKFLCPLNYIEVNDIAAGPKYSAYICTKDGIFLYERLADADKYNMDKIADIKDIKKLAFASVDEPVYWKDDTLYKLTVNAVPCVSD